MTTPTEHPILELLRTRRSPKLAALAAPGPSEDELAAILTIAARVPDHAQLVPWRFIVIQGDRRQHLGNVVGDIFDAANPGADEAARQQARQRLTIAPLVVAVVFSPRNDPANPERPHPKAPEWEQVLSTGAACMNLIVAAKAMGYGAVWLSEWYAYDRRVLDAMGLSPREKLAGFIHVGTVREQREDRNRPALEKIVTRY